MSNQTITEHTKDHCETAHEWVEGYYGHDCKNCSLFYPLGDAPWDMTEEREEQIAREEYEMNHGKCEDCFNEYGDGWSNCTCSCEDCGNDFEFCECEEFSCDQCSGDWEVCDCDEAYE